MFRHSSGRDLTYTEVWQNCREMWITLKEVYTPRRLMIIAGVASLLVWLIPILLSTQ